MRIAPHCLPGHHNHEGHSPQCPWPADAYIQWGGCGIVFTGKNALSTVFEVAADAICGDKSARTELAAAVRHSYQTAFFEAFVKDPDTFIRGEGKDVAAAEQSAFSQLEKYRACPGHHFERKGYRNGAGVCIHCGLFKSDAFAPSETCRNCGANTYYAQDRERRFWCEPCSETMPKELRPAWRRAMEAEDRGAAAPGGAPTGAPPQNQPQGDSNGPKEKTEEG